MKRVLTMLLLMCLMPLGARAEGLSPTPPTAQSSLTAIQIHEFMASNSQSLEDENGETPDWIELYNTGDQPVDLAGLCLSDSKKTLDKFVFPSVILPAGGYLVVLASGGDRVTESEIHLPFKLSADGERVVLSYQGVILDIVSFDRQSPDISMARYDERSWRFTETPTPGAENSFSPEE